MDFTNSDFFFKYSFYTSGKMFCDNIIFARGRPCPLPVFFLLNTIYPCCRHCDNDKLKQYFLHNIENAMLSIKQTVPLYLAKKKMPALHNKNLFSL